MFDIFINNKGHDLYHNEICQWPGCETKIKTFDEFLRHLNTDHKLDDRSTAQTRVQIQVVSILESQLLKERQRMIAMTKHLQVSPVKLFRCFTL
ncbi:uncharacterized protein TRIADDRAFT_23971 [Trichoplax adhaerens]|uniref:FOXP coiled-coil domain-containing protein n=1 Tax=Trichoplax adhaerens TaxID=10228 RepID=B3RUJ3_TRIAD|nr:hypothetical protein TRIADDRAFT_23971 [Trichoplax adhaerens]EDV25826.1 hypothetical protein TRIADDRAFT_23971 [Trichoplax adhaerens]|eukprot:XP_002111859.1 hypothetical protein TRIADDRAFT_23971 [Trichoplax adhaerens]